MVKKYFNFKNNIILYYMDPEPEQDILYHGHYIYIQFLFWKKI
jgi:hypothetical protein